MASWNERPERKEVTENAVLSEPRKKEREQITPAPPALREYGLLSRRTGLWGSERQR